MSHPVAIVTGANKGIGYYIARNLARKGFKIVLGCRSLPNAQAARDQLLHETPNAEIECLPVDISSEKSVREAAHLFEAMQKRTYPARDFRVLVNNAGFAYKTDSTEPFATQAKVTVDINFFGTLHMCTYFTPLLSTEGDVRVVNVSSRIGRLRQLTSSSLRSQMDSPDLSLEALKTLMGQFQSLAQTNDHAAQGWSQSAYGVSKLGVNALTRVLARNQASHIHYTCCCPGWCRTDMAGWENPPKSAEEGAETPTWLATAPSGDIGNGAFYGEKVKLRF